MVYFSQEYMFLTNDTHRGPAENCGQLTIWCHEDETHYPMSYEVFSRFSKATQAAPFQNGLRNFGSTCYINAALQCIFFTISEEILWTLLSNNNEVCWICFSLLRILDAQSACNKRIVEGELYWLLKQFDAAAGSENKQCHLSDFLRWVLDEATLYNYVAVFIASPYLGVDKSLEESNAFEPSTIPKALFLEVPRGHYERVEKGIARVNHNKPIEVPEIIQRYGKTYKLTGCIVHTGTDDGGHYVFLNRHIQVSDESVISIPGDCFEIACTSLACFLCYREQCEVPMVTEGHLSLLPRDQTRRQLFEKLVMNQPRQQLLEEQRRQLSQKRKGNGCNNRQNKKACDDRQRATSQRAPVEPRTERDSVSPQREEDMRIARAITASHESEGEAYNREMAAAMAASHELWQREEAMRNRGARTGGTTPVMPPVSSEPEPVSSAWSLVLLMWTWALALGKSAWSFIAFMYERANRIPPCRKIFKGVNAHTANLLFMAKTFVKIPPCWWVLVYGLIFLHRTSYSVGSARKCLHYALCWFHVKYVTQSETIFTVAHGAICLVALITCGLDLVIDYYIAVCIEGMGFWGICLISMYGKTRYSLGMQCSLLCEWLFDIGMLYCIACKKRRSKQ